MIPKLLDLFCCAGGAGTGYSLAGFDVTGVDIAPQKRYPFTFVQADALAYLKEHGHEYDAIHASPPCQRFSTITKRWGKANAAKHPDLVNETRALLVASGKPYVMENVRVAKLNAILMLCGTMFGLGVIRHRYFEVNFEVGLTPACSHVGRFESVHGHAGGRSKRDGISFGGVDAWKTAIGIDWMVGKELAEAIPPAYTRFIGES